MVFGIVSVIFGTIAIATTNDSKKIVANLSVVHMAATFLLLVAPMVSTEQLVTFS